MNDIEPLLKVKQLFKFFNKRILIIIKISLVLLLFSTENKNKELFEKIKYYFLNIKKNKETINLSNEGLLEIYQNKENRIELETESGIIYKSDIVFLVIPGGSYATVSDYEGSPILKKLFSLGYSSAKLIYSVYPECYPSHYNQGLEAIKILSAKFKKIILVGFSAGGHLAGLLGTTERKKLFNTEAMIQCYPVISFKKKAHERSKTNFFGNRIENNINNQKLFSIENRVTSKTLPTFIWTIKNDRVVPYENTLFMIKALRENNVTNEYKIFNKGRHGMALADDSAVRYRIREYKNKEVAKWLGLACKFIEKIIKNKKK